jgi:hypothetical protein
MPFSDMLLSDYLSNCTMDASHEIFPRCGEWETAEQMQGWRASDVIDNIEETRTSQPLTRINYSLERYE